MQDAHPLTSQKLSIPKPLKMSEENGRSQVRIRDAASASPATTKKVDEGIWASLSKTAKSLFSEDDELPKRQEVQVERGQAPTMKTPSDSKSAFGIQKSLDAITNSLSFIGDRVGTAIEESLDVISTKAVDFIEGPPPSLNQDVKRSPSIGLDGSPATNQLKASRDVATAMVTKVRQYQRQVEAQRAQLDFSTKRCSQLEEENKRLRESLELQGKMDEDPLVRQQLEALLAEKARLARENTQLQRENEHLFELLAYSTQGNRSPSASTGVGGFEVEEEAAAGVQSDGEKGETTPSTARGLLEDGETSSRGVRDHDSGNLGSEVEPSSSAGGGGGGFSRSADLGQKRQATDRSGAAAVGATTGEKPQAGESSTLRLETEPSEHAHEPESGHS